MVREYVWAGADDGNRSISRKSRRIALSTIALLFLITVCRLVGVPNVEAPLTFYVDLANLGLLPSIDGPYRHDHAYRPKRDLAWTVRSRR
jgi:hypothetical protein